MRRLLIRPGAIGDFVLSLPAMEWLAKKNGGHACIGLRARDLAEPARSVPDFFTEVWAESRNLPLARFAGRTRAIASTGLDLLGLPDIAPPPMLLESLRGFNSIVSWYGASRPEFQQAVGGLPFRFLTAVPPEGAGVHAADFYLQQVGGVGEAVPRLGCPPGDGSFIAIHPFSGSPKKNWPLDRYKELGRCLSLHLPVRWILERSGPRVDGVDVEPPIDDLYELACRLAQARLYIGNDSGITHLAAAAGARVLALFGPTDPAVWAPRGPNVRVISTRRPGESIEQVGLADVLEAAQVLTG